MTDRINLTQLREEAQAYIDRQDLWDNAENAQATILASELLALIDATEVANRTARAWEWISENYPAALDAMPSNDWRQLQTLNDTLARFAFAATSPREEPA